MTNTFQQPSRYGIESPRWLINQKRFADAIQQFKIIARINRNSFDLTEEKLAQLYSDVEQEKVYGMASLFCTWRIAKNTIIMGFSWYVWMAWYGTKNEKKNQFSKLNEKIIPFFSFFLMMETDLLIHIISAYSLRCVAAVSFFVLVLFSSQMGGNPFLNFLLQSIVEIPAYIVGKYFGKLFFIIFVSLLFSLLESIDWTVGTFFFIFFIFVHDNLKTRSFH